MIDIICCVDVQVDGLGQIQGEDSHDRLRVDDVTSGDEIEVLVKFGEVVDKGFYLVDGIERNRNCFHYDLPQINTQHEFGYKVNIKSERIKVNGETLF